MKLTSLRAGLAGAALVACGLLAAPAAAVAAPPAGSPGVDHARVPAAESATAAQYWTADRMRAAEPADVLVADRVASTPASEVAKGDPVTYGKPVPAPEVDLNAAVRGAGLEHRQGVLHPGRPQLRVLGELRQRDQRQRRRDRRSLRARRQGQVRQPLDLRSRLRERRGALRPVGRDVVLGAHPVDQGRRHHVRHRVREGGSAERSHARADRRRLGVAFNQARGLAYEAFGYPAAAPFDGQTLKSCAGTATPDPYCQTQSQGIPCDMTGGSSGGPWFLGSARRTRSTASATTTSPNVMFGPYYGTVAQTAYATAAAS